MNAVYHARVLVLNKSWVPVGVVGLRRAVSLIFTGVAAIIDPEAGFTIVNGWEEWGRTRPRDGEPHLATAREKFRVPKLILLRRYDKTPSQRLKFSRRSLYRRDRHECQYCGGTPGASALTIDHVIPRSHGGPTSWENCVAACGPCNSRKANRTPEQAGMALRATPARPKYGDLRADDTYKSWEPFLGYFRE